MVPGSCSFEEMLSAVADFKAPVFEPGGSMQQGMYTPKGDTTYHFAIYVLFSPHNTLHWYVVCTSYCHQMAVWLHDCRVSTLFSALGQKHLLCSNRCLCFLYLLQDMTRHISVNLKFICNLVLFCQCGASVLYFN